MNPFGEGDTQNLMLVEPFLGGIPIDALAATAMSLVASWSYNCRLQQRAADREGGALALWVTRAPDFVELGVACVVNCAPATGTGPPRKNVQVGDLCVVTSASERRLALLYGADGTLERTVIRGSSRAILRIPLARHDEELYEAARS